MTALERAARQALEALLKAGLGRTIRVNQKAIDSAVGILRAALAQQAEPVVDTAQCDGGQCGVGGYCKTCPKQQAKPVAEPVQVTYAMVEAAEAAHDAARGLQGGFWRSAVPAMIEAALAAQQQAEPVVLTDAEIEQMLLQWRFSRHGELTRYLVRMTEKAHGIKGAV